MPYLIDTHCHIHFPSFDATRVGVMQRMREKRIAAITVGTSIRTSQEGIAFAEKYDDVWATVGYHPEHLTSSYHDDSEGPPDAFDLDAIAHLARSSPNVVAIGETGLDFFRIDPHRAIEEAHHVQERVFRQHLHLAHELKKPLIIHCRDAFRRLAEILQEEQQNAGYRVEGVVHCFTGSWDEAKLLLDLGLHLSFTGIITFPLKKDTDPEHHVHRVIERMPLDRLLVETDAPWLAPIPHRGEKNEPAFVEYVAQRVAELRRTDFNDIACKTTENAQRLFQI